MKHDTTGGSSNALAASRSGRYLALGVAYLWQAIAYLVIELPLLVPRYPIAPDKPGWVELGLVLPGWAALFGLGALIPLRRALLHAVGVSALSGAFSASMSALHMPYYADQGVVGIGEGEFIVGVLGYLVLASLLVLIGYGGAKVLQSDKSKRNWKGG